MSRKINGIANGRKLATQQSVNAAIKSICAIMRRSNCAGALQYVPELTWILFLSTLDERETREAEEAEAVDPACRAALQEELDIITKLPSALLRRAFSGGL